MRVVGRLLPPLKAARGNRVSRASLRRLHPPWPPLCKGGKGVRVVGRLLRRLRADQRLGCDIACASTPPGPPFARGGKVCGSSGGCCQRFGRNSGSAATSVRRLHPPWPPLCKGGKGVRVVGRLLPPLKLAGE